MYVKFIKPYTHKILQLITFSLSPSTKHLIDYSRHPLHQSPAVVDLLLEQLRQAQPQRQHFPMANVSQCINISETKLCTFFRRTKPAQCLRLQPGLQKKQSKTSAIICDIISNLLSLSIILSMLFYYNLL